MRQEHCCFGVSVSRLKAAHSRPTVSEQITLRYGILCVYVCVCMCVFLFKMYYISLSYSSVDNWFGEIVLSFRGSGTILFVSLSFSPFVPLFVSLFHSFVYLCSWMHCFVLEIRKVISVCSQSH